LLFDTIFTGPEELSEKM